ATGALPPGWGRGRPTTAAAGPGPFEDDPTLPRAPLEPPDAEAGRRRLRPPTTKLVPAAGARWAIGPLAPSTATPRAFGLDTGCRSIWWMTTTPPPTRVATIAPATPATGTARPLPGGMPAS